MENLGHHFQVLNRFIHFFHLFDFSWLSLRNAFIYSNVNGVSQATRTTGHSGKKTREETETNLFYGEVNNIANWVDAQNAKQCSRV